MKFKTKTKCDLRGLKTLRGRLAKGFQKEGRAGYYSDQTHPENGQALSDIAYYNTFGSDKGMIPERPFMQDGAKDSAKWVAPKLAQVWSQILQGKSAEKSWEEATKTLSFWISNVILLNTYQSNAPYTIRRKGFDRPLYHTGHLSQAIRVGVFNRGAT